MGTSVNSRVKDLPLMYVSSSVSFNIKNKERDGEQEGEEYKGEE